MELKDRINLDLKTAMKSGDKLRLETIRSIRALILEFEKSGLNKDLNNEESIRLLTTAVKKRKDAMEQFRNAGRVELADKEEAEMNIIMEYLPKQLTEDELEAKIRSLASEVNATSKADFPKLMPAAAKQFKGQADGKMIKTIVEKILGS